jgi:hypothetical protein
MEAKRLLRRDEHAGDVPNYEHVAANVNDELRALGQPPSHLRRRRWQVGDEFTCTV